MDSKGNQNNKQKGKQTPRTDNVLEALRDIGSSGSRVVKNEATQISKDFVKQLFGAPEVRTSGDLEPGQSIEIDRVLAEGKEENKTLRLRLQHEQTARQEEEVLVERKTQELKVELHALLEEVKSLAQTTQGISEEVEIAAMQAPVNPGVYHVVFFEKLREFIASFRKKIENAAIWLHTYNQRAAKKRTFWGQVARSGSKRLLSPEDYLQRSAG